MIRVLIADDSTPIRLLLRSVLTVDPEIEIAGTAANAQEAVDKFLQLRPDIVVLDPDMPVVDGLAVLSAIRRLEPEAAVVLFRSAPGAGARAPLEARVLGACECLDMPGGATREQMSETVRERLIPAIKRCVEAQRRDASPCGAEPGRAAPRGKRQPTGAEVVVVAASTGGTEAVKTVLQALPADFRIPVLIAQHMPADLIGEFVRRLTRCCRNPVAVAEDGGLVEPGRIWVARGGYHMECARKGPFVRLHLHQGPPEHGNRPAADPLFRSAAIAYGRCALGVVLTGMGTDGLAGCGAIHAAGGQIVVQDGATSVVWGMPGAVVNAGIADAVVAVGTVASEIAARVSTGNPLAAWA